MLFTKCYDINNKTLSKVFDKKMYLELYPDVLSIKMDPLEHYLQYGWKKRYLPYKGFMSFGNTFNVCPLVYDVILKNYRNYKQKLFDDMFLPKNIDYDFIVPLGNRCFCSEYLRILGLQKESLPFDWSAHENYVPKLEDVILRTDINLLNVLHLIVNDFKDFLNIEDFIEYEDEVGDGSHRFCVNQRTGLHYIHELKKSESIETGFIDFKDRYCRRIERFIRNIEKSKRIAFVWVQDVFNYIPRGQKEFKLSNESLIFTLQQLKKKFPKKQIDIYVFMDDENLKEDEIKTEIINNNIYKYTSNHEILFKMIYNTKYNIFLSKGIYNVLSKLTLRGRKW